MKEKYVFVAKPLGTRKVSYVDFPVFEGSLYMELLINQASVTVKNNDYHYHPTSDLDYIRADLHKLGVEANSKIEDIPRQDNVGSEQLRRDEYPFRLYENSETQVLQESKEEVHRETPREEPREERYSIRKKFASILANREKSGPRKRYSATQSRSLERMPRDSQREKEPREEDTKSPPSIGDLLKDSDTGTSGSGSGGRLILSAEEELEQRQELLGQFAKLRMKYSNMDSLGISIPEFSIRSDLQRMKVTYSSVSKLLKTKQTIATYKKYLTMLFIVVELVFGQFLGFNMNGYLESQKDSMSSYDSLLIELSEKYNKDKKSKLPVEMRLMGMMGLNIVMFVAANNLMNGQFGILGKLMGGLMKGKSSKASESNKTEPMKMKGERVMMMRKPTATLEKIRESADASEALATEDM